MMNYELNMKFYFLHMKDDENGTTLKHVETINVNVKKLSKRIEKVNIILCLTFYIILLEEFSITITY